MIEKLDAPSIICARSPFVLHVTVEETIHEYYEALRRGEPLAPFVHPEATVKFGVSEALYGSEEIADGLAEQTQTTTEWSVESDRLQVDDHGSFTVFCDEVRLQWTEIESGDRHDVETRWSGTLWRRGARWQFVSLHVSVPQKR